MLAPFATMEAIAEAVPRIVASGIGPMILEYIDIVAMAGIEAASGIELGVGPEVRAETLAYLVVVLEDRSDERLDEDAEELADHAGRAGRHRRVRPAPGVRGGVDRGA